MGREEVELGSVISCYVRVCKPNGHGVEICGRFDGWLESGAIASAIGEFLNRPDAELVDYVLGPDSGIKVCSKKSFSGPVRVAELDDWFSSGEPLIDPTPLSVSFGRSHLRSKEDLPGIIIDKPGLWPGLDHQARISIPDSRSLEVELETRIAEGITSGVSWSLNGPGLREIGLEVTKKLLRLRFSKISGQVVQEALRLVQSPVETTSIHGKRRVVDMHF